MYVLATSPEFQFFAFWRYQLDELSSLENGHCRLELERFPEILKNMIRKYNEDGLPGELRNFAEKKGYRIGPHTMGPDLLWVDSSSSFPASHPPTSRCYVLLAVNPPERPATNTPAKTMLTVQSVNDGSTVVEVEWHVGYVYLLEESEVATVSNGGIAFVGIQYATQPVS